MSLNLLMLTTQPRAYSVLPGLQLLAHNIRVRPLEGTALLEIAGQDAILLDARTDLAAAKSLCRLIAGTGAHEHIPVIVVVGEGGLVAINADWRADDILLPTASPAEVDTRIRLAATRGQASNPDDTELRVGDLVIDEATYTARLPKRTLELTYKEFELLKYLTQHAGRVFTRAHLLQEVWGYDFFGGTRTVDVHIRRLRAKLGPEHEQKIGTVRNVGYKFNRPGKGAAREDSSTNGLTTSATQLPQPRVHIARHDAP